MAEGDRTAHQFLSKSNRGREEVVETPIYFGYVLDGEETLMLLSILGLWRDPHFLSPSLSVHRKNHYHATALSEISADAVIRRERGRNIRVIYIYILENLRQLRII